MQEAFVGDVSDGCTYHGRVSISAGGVGRNVADCLSKLGSRPFFISRVGDDLYAQLLSRTNSYLEQMGGIEISESESTAKCSVVLNSKKECEILVGDFGIHSGIDAKMIRNHEQVIKRSPMLIMDANIPLESTNLLLDLSEQYDIPVWYEPTDIKKADYVFRSPKWTVVTYASPNLHELKVMAKATGQDVGHVQEILDEGNKENLKNYCLQASKTLLESWKLLVVTLGSLGVMTLSREGDHLTRVSRIEAPIRAQYFPPLNPHPNIVSVTGAGDCLVAGMANSLLNGASLEKSVQVGLKLAEISITSQECVPPSINPNLMI